MDSLAQTGADYLMTYVSLLIILVAALSVFFVVLQPKFTCISGDEKIAVESYSMPFSKNYVQTVCNSETCSAWGYLYGSDPAGKMVLQNSTGEKISVLSVEPSNRTYLLDGKPGCGFVQLFVPYYLNGKSYNQVNAGEAIEIDSGKNMVISSLFLMQEAIGSGCLAKDFAYPETYSFNFTYSLESKEQKTAEITCNGFPEKN
ncbi:MAG: hypothetical protein PHH08_05125 [Candidatus ainarchaeum sp.]|nr:hypothetical protein [Candidatus ainarchaeum sp.]